ncbi:efflux RND transporter periplasmic adaptor subunit [Gallaecimonas kandeliae]|uniref:efflux RND transporter periplasmic adaptor subunit n=1 Tax=Gallaecimonas kandeliae TaxID=3029055 RepID=UPI0026488FB1|nr:efflux RND transporter periplasmic adaptor subunit [Gallaecimonas kandeliae]WKE66577.1 efflux RND transporter periplasmic adaptor subunit [Gallaecimonas kandeliae]
MKKLALVVVLALIAAAFWWQHKQQAAPTHGKAALVRVVTRPVAMQLLSDEIEALGTTQAFESVTITASVSDKIEEVLFHDNQQVKAGDLLVTLQHQEEQAALDAAEVDLKEQQREYRRITDLVKKKTIAASELDRLQSAVDLAKANVAKSQAQLNDRFIRAPFDGRLGFRQVSTGALVSPGTAITTLDDVSPIKLDFTVPERFLPILSPGKDIHASSEAVPDRRFQGKVASIDTRIDPVSRSATVRAELDNQDGSLRPGMLLRVRLVKEARRALAVPAAALFQLKDQHFVFVVDKDHKVSQRAVQTGLRLPGLVEVVAGLKEGEHVVIRGLLKVRDGATVEEKQEDYPGAKA